MLCPSLSKTSALLIKTSRVSYGKLSTFSNPFAFRILMVSSIISSSASVLKASSISSAKALLRYSSVFELFVVNSFNRESMASLAFWLLYWAALTPLESCSLYGTALVSGAKALALLSQAKAPGAKDV